MYKTTILENTFRRDVECQKCENIVCTLLWKENCVCCLDMCPGKRDINEFSSFCHMNYNL